MPIETQQRANAARGDEADDARDALRYAISRRMWAGAGGWAVLDPVAALEQVLAVIDARCGWGGASGRAIRERGADAGLRTWRHL